MAAHSANVASAVTRPLRCSVEELLASSGVTAWVHLPASSHSALGTEATSSAVGRRSRGLTFLPPFERAKPSLSDALAIASPESCEESYRKGRFRYSSSGAIARKYQ